MNHLRPIERVIVRLDNENASLAEIGRRVGKKPGTVSRILKMIEYKVPGEDNSRSVEPGGLRPIERVIIRLRERGESYGEIGNRTARSGAQIRRIEKYARIRNQ